MGNPLKINEQVLASLGVPGRFDNARFTDYIVHIPEQLNTFMSSDQLSPLIADLHLLTVLAATRSFTETARRLGVSKASASTRISELERSAGVLLVRRTTRSVGLT